MPVRLAADEDGGDGMGRRFRSGRKSRRALEREAETRGYGRASESENKQKS